MMGSITHWPGLVLCYTNADGSWLAIGPVICNNNYESGSAKCLELDVPGKRVGDLDAKLQGSAGFWRSTAGIEFACQHDCLMLK